MPELVLQITRAGFLALLWLFVLAALRVVRSDLYAASGLRAAAPGGRRPPRGGTSKPARGGGRSGPKALIVTAGALAGTRIALDGRPIMIGRADDSTLVLDDDYASTRHARISQSGDDWYVEDSRVHQRHVPRPQQGLRTDPRAARYADPDRQDGHRAPVMTAAAPDSAAETPVIRTRVSFPHPLPCRIDP